MKKIEFNPSIGIKEEIFLKFCKSLRLKLKKTQDRYALLIRIKEELNNEKNQPLSELKNYEISLLLSQNILIDLLLQDWILNTRGKRIWLEFIEEELTIHQAKEKIRRRHLLARDSQLRTKSVVEFVQNMERRRLSKFGWHSIFSLMKNGKVLSSLLREIRKSDSDSAKLELLSKSIKPYIQIVEENKRCEFTDLRLMDIWRYFRHTWVNEYKSVPGRSINILIRDAGGENHPIIGIAALGSSMVQFSVRDNWIGWESKTFLKKLIESPSFKKAKWITSVYEDLLEDIYVKDFIKDKIITKARINNPTEDVISSLKNRSSKERKLHNKFPDQARMKNYEKSDLAKIDWKKRAMSHLFRSKRLLALSELLSIKKTLVKYNYKEPNTDLLKEALKSSEFKNAIGKLVRKAKAAKVGVNIMDITVCGSIAPYNHILGGKLICMLLTSPEISTYYKKKYRNSISLIASSVRGKALIRPANLAFLGTTSLYSIGASQYNRVKIPVSIMKDEVRETIKYHNLGYSEGFGSFHFSKETLEISSILLGRRKGGRKVNSIFGEGANPLMRKIKEAIELLNLESHPILKHNNKRVVYGIPLASNFKEFLIGLDKIPKYFWSQKKTSITTESIGKYWIKRWLRNRINNDKVLSAMEKHTLSYPIEHGAKVPIKEEKDDWTLF